MLLAKNLKKDPRWATSERGVCRSRFLDKWILDKVALISDGVTYWSAAAAAQSVKVEELSCSTNLPVTIVDTTESFRARRWKPTRARRSGNCWLLLNLLCPQHSPFGRIRCWIHLKSDWFIWFLFIYFPFFDIVWFFKSWICFLWWVFAHQVLIKVISPWFELPEGFCLFSFLSIWRDRFTFK